MADKFNEQLTRERNAVEQVGVIKNAIKSVAENKSIEVLDTDTPQSVLSKIDKFSGGDYNIESAILEDGTQELRIFDAEKGVKETVGRPEPETWKRIRETLHTNPNDQFFLIGSGASDTFALKLSGTGYDITVYGGTDGTTFLFGDVLDNTTAWSLWRRDVVNYPLPNGLHFSDLQGCPYSDDIIGECELFAVVVHNPKGIAYSFVNTPNFNNTERFEYRVLEYAGNSAELNLLRGTSEMGSCTSCEFAFLGDSLKRIGMNAFRYTSLHSIDIPEGVTDIENNAFSSCYNLKKVKLPSTLTTISSSAFSSYSALEQVIIPEGVRVINAYAFENGHKLRMIVLPNSLTTLGGSALSQLPYITEIKLPTNIKTLPNSIFNSNESLINVDYADDITQIGYNAFGDCYSLRNINIPETVTYIGNYAFINCRSLEKLESNCTAIRSYLDANGSNNLRYANMPNTQVRGILLYGVGTNTMRIGSFGEVEGSESPTLGLKTPIFVDYANSLFDGSATPIQLQYACLTLDHLKSIFD